MKHFPIPSKKEHYKERKEKNGKHPTYNQVKGNEQWTEVPQNQAKFHDNGIGKPEIKYTHIDGREAVFDGDTLQPVTDPRYLATYNYYPIRQLPADPKATDYLIYTVSAFEHGRQDVIPYIFWGNNSEDAAMITWFDRFCMSF